MRETYEKQRETLTGLEENWLLDYSSNSYLNNNNNNINDIIQ